MGLLNLVTMFQLLLHIVYRGRAIVIRNLVLSVGGVAGGVVALVTDIRLVQW